MKTDELFAQTKTLAGYGWPDSQAHMHHTCVSYIFVLLWVFLDLALCWQVYVSLDYESRFVGKEIIGLFVNRVGKSAMAIGLSLVTNWFGQSKDQWFVQALSVSSLLWLFASYPLAQPVEKELKIH